MLKYDYIIGVDPSGSFKEGKGTSGFAVLNCRTDTIQEVHEIRAKDFASDVPYWLAHVKYILLKAVELNGALKVVVEDYLLYAHKADAQINSRMETSQLLGILKVNLEQQNIPYEIRPASAVKKRWANPILLRRGYITKCKGGFMAANKKLNNHMTDAIRHAVHEHIFYNVEKDVPKAIKSIRRIPKLKEI